MTEDVASILRRRIEEGKSENVFGDDSFKAIVAALRRGFRAACEAVGGSYGYGSDGAVIHTIRHSAATYLTSPEVNLPLPVVMYILGHADISMSFKYTHPTPEGMQDAMRALAKFGVRSESAAIPDMPVMPVIEDQPMAAKAE